MPRPRRRAVPRKSMLPLACRIPLFSAFGGAAVSLPQALFSLTSSFSCCRSVSIFSLKPVSTAAGLRSPPPNIGGVVPTGPPKWLPSPPPLTNFRFFQVFGAFADTFNQLAKCRHFLQIDLHNRRHGVCGKPPADRKKRKLPLPALRGDPRQDAHCAARSAPSSAASPLTPALDQLAERPPG